MDWLKNLFATIGSFFKRAAKTAIGVAARKLEKDATEIINRVEVDNPGISGKVKARMAYEMMRAKYPDVKTAAINLAIELAVALLKG